MGARLFPRETLKQRRAVAAVVAAAVIGLAPLAGPLGQTAHAAGQAPEERAEPLSDPVLEARALALGRQLRCVVCQNQSIAESNAELAHDLMNEVRSMLRAGKSEAEIIDFLVARYGQFVLFKPPFDGRTLLLWIGPFLLAGVALWGLWAAVRARNRQAGIPPLDEAEKARADALLADEPLRKDLQ